MAGGRQAGGTVLHVQMEDVFDRALTEGLPEALRQRVHAEEQGRLDNYVDLVVECARSVPDEHAAVEQSAAFTEAAVWQTHIDSLLKGGSTFDVRRMFELFEAVQHLCFVTTHAPNTQRRWLRTAYTVLQSYRDEFHLQAFTVPWLPYWQELHAQIERMRTPLQDGGHAMLAFSFLLSVICQVKHLFPGEAAADIWGRVEGDLAQPLTFHCYHALLLLLTFWPHRAVSTHRELPWDVWAQRGMDLWGAMRHQHSWNRLWIAFFARLAKWDRYDVIDWERILRPLCLRATWFFQVPTGGSTSSQSFQPQDAAFAKIAGAATADVSTASRLAKILVWTLRRDLTKAPSAPGGQTPLASIAGLASLLEHYYHASNSGRYSSDLADFLSSLIVQLSGSRLRWEAAPYWRGAAHVRLDPRGLAPVTEVLYGLAAVSVHHKSSAMQAAAAQALARLAYLAPQRCLPFITRCLHESLESHDAVHQIDQAITLFASVVRPMLVHGLPALADGAGDVLADGAASPHERARLEIGRVMELLLPALDANDEDKLLAALSFYTAVFGACTALEGPQGGGEGVDLGIDLVAFVQELLQRLFAAVDTLQSGKESTGMGDDEGAATQAMVSVLGDHFKLHGLMSQLFQKLPAAAVDAAAELVTTRARTTVDPRQAEDLTLMVEFACRARPALAEERVLLPLVATCAEDIASEPADGRLTTAFSTSMLARQSILSAVIPAIGAGADHKHADAIYSMCTAAMGSHSRAISYAAFTTLCKLLSHLAVPCVRFEAVRADAMPGIPNKGVARWVPCSYKDAHPVPWQMPTAEGTALARSLAERAIAECTAEADAMIADGSIREVGHGPRKRLRRAQLLGYCAAGIVTDVAPPVSLKAGAPEARAAGGPEALCICDVQLPGWEGFKGLEDALAATLRVAAHADPANVHCMGMVISTIDAATGMSNAADQASGGYIEEINYAGNDFSFLEGPVADLLVPQAIGAGGLSARRAPWIVAHTASQSWHARRAALRATWHATKSAPTLHVTDVHPLLLRSIAALHQLTLSRYSGVSSAAVDLIQHMYTWCREVALYALPCLIAAAGLMRSRSDCGMPSELLVEELKLPSTRAEVAGMLSQQCEVLTATVAADWSSVVAPPDAGADAAMDMSDDAASDASGLNVSQDSLQAAAPNGPAHARPPVLSPRTCLRAHRQGSLATGSGALPDGAALLRTATVPSALSDGSGSDQDNRSPSAAIAAASRRDDAVEPEPPPLGGSPVPVRQPSLQMGAGHHRRSLERPLASPPPVQPSSPRGAMHAAARLFERRASHSRAAPPAAAAIAALSSLPAAALPHDIAQKVENLLRDPDAAMLSSAELDELHASAARRSTASRQGEARAAEAEAEEDGVCTEANKHVVVGALDALEATRGYHTYVGEVEPLALRALFLLTMALQRYEPVEVKELANTLIAYVPCVLMYVPGPGSPENARLFAPTAALLAHKTVSAKLHWREAAVAELLFAHVAPCMQDAGALQPIVAAQVHDLLSGSTLIAKEMGFVALLSTLTIAANPKAPHGDPHRAAALAATSDAFGAHDAWPRSYVATLQAMQSLSASDRVKAFHALEEAPEQAFVVSASSVVTQSRVLEWHPHLCAEPKSTGADGGLSILSVPAVLGTEMLARVVGAPFVASLREPLEAWAAMDQAARKREQHMDFVSMEIVLGCLSSSRTHTADPTGHTTWDAWMRAFVDAQLAAAGLENGALWAFVVAKAMQVVGRDITGASSDRLHVTLVDTDAAAAAFDALADFVLANASAWAGASLLEAKTAVLLHHGMDSLLQVQLERPHDTVSRALARMVRASIDIAETMASQRLQKLRMVVSKLARMALSIVRSPVPVLPAEDLCGSAEGDANSLQARAVRVYATARSDGEAALAAAVAAPPGDAAAAAAEAPIAWQAALLQQADRKPELGGLCRDVALAGMPWVLAAQALDHPDMPSVNGEVRRLLRLKACPLEEVEPRRDALAAAMAHEAWQERLSAVYIMQAFWFRNYFALSAADMLEMVRQAHARLRDARMEIRTHASHLLSGLVKCAPAAGVAAFRGEVLATASALFEKRAPKRERGGAAGGAWLIDRHACVLALQALLASSPYEIKEWMHAVLLALTAAVRFPTPVKQTVTEALDEFKQSHKDMSPLPLRDRLPEGVWDAIQDVASTSSYFV